jgi:hypothetical protein
MTEAHTPNTGLAKVAVQCSADTFVVNQSLVLRINICGENRHLRQARKRQAVKKLSFILIKYFFCCIIFEV